MGPARLQAISAPKARSFLKECFFITAPPVNDYMTYLKHITTAYQAQCKILPIMFWHRSQDIEFFGIGQQQAKEYFYRERKDFS